MKWRMESTSGLVPVRHSPPYNKDRIRRGGGAYLKLGANLSIYGNLFSIVCVYAFINTSMIFASIKLTYCALKFEWYPKGRRFMSWPVLIFHFIQVLFQYDESRKVLDLRPNQHVDVKECFSMDNEACLIFQKIRRRLGRIYRCFHPGHSTQG